METRTQSAGDGKASVSVSQTGFNAERQRLCSLVAYEIYSVALNFAPGTDSRLAIGDIKRRLVGLAELQQDLLVNMRIDVVEAAARLDVLAGSDVAHA